MGPLCYRRHRFPPEIIQHAIWLYLRFTLSYRDVEELLAVRGLDISYETVRRWVPAIARRRRQRRPRPSDRWHLDEMVVRIAGKRMYLWRAVDHEGEVLDMLVQRRREGHDDDRDHRGDFRSRPSEARGLPILCQRGRRSGPDVGLDRPRFLKIWIR